MKHKSTNLCIFATTIACITMVSAQTSTPPSAGDGSSGDPYRIATLDNLYWLTQNDTAWANGIYIIQTADIDASTSASWDGGSGFAPIGNNTDRFNGNYDGQSYSITGLTIKRSTTSYVGLFGRATTSSSLKNIRLLNVNIEGDDFVGALAGNARGGVVANCEATGTVVGANYVGGLVGHNLVSIRNCSTSGHVSGTGFGIGGLVGQLEIATDDDATNCFFTGSVSGGQWVGGLFGLVFYGGPVSQCYSTGSVEGTSAIGGIAGYITGEIAGGGTLSDSYSLAVVMGEDSVGGIAGVNNGGKILHCYSAGSVKGSTFVGGLVGYSIDSFTGDSYSRAAVEGSTGVGGLIGGRISGALTTSYWDRQTSGQTISDGGDGKTTSELQGSLPNGFSSADWGTSDGLYPYLLWQHANLPKAVSGTAYEDAGTTPFSSDASGTRYISGYVDGTALDTVTTGANGYYYILVDSTTISSSGSSILTFLVGSSGSRIDTADSTAADFDIWGSTLIGPTSATSYSSASATSLLVQNATLLSNAVGSNSDPTTGLSQFGYVVYGSFTLDEALTNSLYVRTRGTDLDITTTNSITLSGANVIAFYATGDIAFGGPVTLSGGGLRLEFGGDYHLANGSSISFTGGSGSGESLTINDTSYTLLYTMSDIQDVNNSLTDKFALASSLNASSTSSWTPIGTDGAGTITNSGNGFAGTFAGLGNTIADLTIDNGSVNYTGLFGCSSGTIRDLLLDGGTTTGGSNVGPLVGFNNGGTISNAGATATVYANGSSGGLVGRNTGTLTAVFASGDVLATDSNSNFGGLVGLNTGSVNKAFALGSVTGNSSTGGLIGFNNTGGSVADAYALGDVTSNSGGNTGGLVGANKSSVTTSYSAGLISSTGVLGGLVGFNNGGTTTNSHWNTETSEQSASDGGTGLTYAEMEAEANFSGFDFTNTWSIIENGSYPYLQGLDQSPEPGVVPVKPRSLDVTDSLVSAISIAWKQSHEPDFLRYRIYAGTEANPATAVDSTDGGIEDTSITVNLNNNQQYFLRVTAVDDDGNESEYSNELTATPGDYVAPAAPQGLAVTDSSYVTSFAIAWNKNAEADVAKYRIFRSTSAGASTLSDSTSSDSDTTNNPSDLTATVRYYFRIAAVDTAGNQSAYSNEVDASSGLATVSGTVYSDTGANPITSATVILLVNGSVFDSTVTDGSGNFTIPDSTGTIGNGSSVLAYYDGVNGGAQAGNWMNGIAGFNIWGGMLNSKITSATTYTSDPLNDITSLVSQAVGESNSTVSDFVSGLERWYIATGSGLSIDTVITIPIHFKTTSSGANIVVAESISISGSQSFSFDAGDNLLIEAPIVVSGGSSVTLTTGSEYRFTQTGSLSFTDSSASPALTINGASYMLLYSMTSMQAINSGLSADYALASSLDASDVTGWVPIGTDGTGSILNSNNGFNGIFTGLGHTLSNLSVNIGSSNLAGMFGYTRGTIRDLQLSGISVTGGSNVGALIGKSVSGTIRRVSVNSSNVSGSRYVGGLVGYNDGSVVLSSHSGTVTGSVEQTGGLVGINYLSGTIAESFSGGSVVGKTSIGGLVGLNTSSGVVSSSYSTADAESDSGSGVGGLAGTNNGSIDETYSSGLVTAGISVTAVGGLVGSNGGTVANSYWNTELSGQSASAGGSGFITEEMKDSVNFSGFDFNSVWTIDQNTSYPYLRDNIQSPSPGYDDEPLAVEATSFSASAALESVTLTWLTKTEISNAGFNIQRNGPSSSDTVTFHLVSSFVSNDSLKGLGTSNVGRQYSYTDHKVQPARTYRYKIQSVSSNGDIITLANITVTTAAPKEYALYQNYPNPFNPTTTIRYDLKQPSNVTIEVYNSIGQRVLEKNNGILNAGRYDEVFDMHRFATGMYIYRITAVGANREKFTAVKKMLLTK